MLKSTLLAAVFGLVLIVPASAENKKCDDDTMTAMSAEIDMLTDEGKKAEAAKAMEEAKAKMAANDMDGCGASLDAAAAVYK